MIGGAAIADEPADDDGGENNMSCDSEKGSGRDAGDSDSGSRIDLEGELGRILDEYLDDEVPSVKLGDRLGLEHSGSQQPS